MKGYFQMSLLSHVVNLIFPTKCQNCDSTVSADAATSYFCKECWNGIEWFDSPCCPQCGLPYASPYTFAANKSYSEQSAAGHLGIVRLDLFRRGLDQRPGFSRMRAGDCRLPFKTGGPPAFPGLDFVPSVYSDEHDLG